MARFSRLKLSFCVFVCACLSVQSHSQTPVENLFERSLEELLQINIRSANKINESLENIPASVVVLTRNDIANYGYRTFSEILRNIPGIYIEEDTEESYIGTRGTIGDSIQFLVNGVPQNRSLQQGLTTVEINRMNIPVGSIDRIEFIRGPMSVIYGNNAFAGTLNIITNKHEAGLLQFAYGSNDTNEAFLSASKQNQNGSVGVNLGASRQGGFSGDYDEMLGASQLPLLTPQIKSTMQGNMGREWRSIDVYGNWQGFSGGLRYQRSINNIYSTLPPTLNGDNTLELRTTQLSLAYEYQSSSSVRSRSMLLYGRDMYDIDKFYFIDPALNGFQQQQSKHLEFEQNIELFSDQTNSLLLGYRFAREFDVRNNAEVELGGSYLVDRDRRVEDISSHDLFAQYHHNIGEQLKVVVGGRYSRLPDGHRRTEIASKLATVVELNTPTEDRDQWNYRLALQYSVNNNHLLKVLFGTASQQPRNTDITDTESIATMELVHVFSSDSWLIQQSIYHNDIKNIVRRSLTFDTNTAMFTDEIVNDGHWKTDGYELNAEYRLNENWRLIGSVSWQTTDDLDSRLDVGYSPPLLLKLKTDYRYRRHTVAVFAYYVDERQADWRFEDTNNDMQPDTEVRLGQQAAAYWNLGTNWRYQLANNTQLDLHISNLLNKQFRYPANEVSDLERGLIGLGREITLRVSVDY